MEENKLILGEAFKDASRAIDNFAINTNTDTMDLQVDLTMRHLVIFDGDSYFVDSSLSSREDTIIHTSDDIFKAQALCDNLNTE